MRVCSVEAEGLRLFEIHWSGNINPCGAKYPYIRFKARLKQNEMFF